MKERFADNTGRIIYITRTCDGTNIEWEISRSLRVKWKLAVTPNNSWLGMVVDIPFQSNVFLPYHRFHFPIEISAHMPITIPPVFT